MLFPDYQSLVVLDYQKKRAENALHLYFTQPSPARLREVCKAVCDDRFDRKDEQILKTFFGEGGNKEACLKAIDACDIDRFRPLIKFLKDPTIKTDLKNVELLAWLIDFKPRPFKWGEMTGIPEIPGIPAAKSEEAQKKEEEKEATPASIISSRPAPKFKARGVILAVIILMLFGGAIYWGGSKKGIVMGSPSPQGCMYWAGDHYQQVPCNQKIDDAQVIALDPERLAQFKKITRQDTITTSCIGKVWCVKYKGNYEYYTASGFHPIDQQLRLRPLSRYIFDNHILSNR